MAGQAHIACLAVGSQGKTSWAEGSALQLRIERAPGKRSVLLAGAVRRVAAPGRTASFFS